MPKYMISILYGDGKDAMHPNDDEFVMQKYGEWTQSLGEKIVIAHKLFDRGGRRLELKGGKISDGPFTETKESIGGFYVIEAKDEAEAAKLARDCPTLLYQGGAVEVREVEI